MELISSLRVRKYIFIFYNLFSPCTHTRDKMIKSESLSLICGYTAVIFIKFQPTRIVSHANDPFN